MRLRSASLLAALVLLAPRVHARYDGAVVAPSAAAAPAPFILDPGHGGEDLGAVVGKHREKDIALAIARKLKQRLESAGEPVKLTRDSDIYLPLQDRVEESAQGAAFISLHLNKVRAKRTKGIAVYAFGKERFRLFRRHRNVPPLPPPPAEEVRASVALADAIVRSLRAQGLRVEPAARASYYVLKNPAVPSVLIELGYLSNPQEAARLEDPAYQDRLADALAVSLQSYTMTAAAQPLKSLQAKAGHGR